MPRFSGIPVEQEKQPRFKGAPPESATAGPPAAVEFPGGLGFEQPQRASTTVPMTTMAKMAFVDDPATKARIAAEKLFPDDPNAIKRFGMQDGEIVYRDPQWNLKYLSPGGFTGTAKEFIAEQPAYLPAEALGVIGAGAGPWTAGLGVAGGEGIRKAVGGLLFDEPQTVTGNIASMAGQGLLGGILPAYGGKLIGKGLQRGVTKDVEALNPADLQRLDDLSRQYGIPLTIAEKTNLPSLKGYQTALQNIPESADIMQKFIGERGDQVAKAVTGQMEKISPVQSAEQAAEMAIKAVGGAKEKIAKEMAAKARPLYEAAYASGKVDIQDVVNGLDQTIAKYPQKGNIANSLNRVKNLITENGVPTDSLEKLDYAKRDIDVLIGKAQREGKGPLVRELMQHKNALLSKLDDLSPDYKIARNIWTEGSDALEKIDSTAVRVIANLPEERWQTAAQRMFNPKTTGPNAVAKAKAVIAKEDPSAWNALTRSYIESAWDDAGKTSEAMRGATFRRLLFGDEKKRRILQSALEPNQYKAVADLMDILDATGRVKVVGSDTAYKQEIIKELNDKWGAGWNDISRPISKVNEMLGRYRAGKNAKQFAEILTSQDSIKSIKLIKQLPPGSQARINAVSVLLGQQAVPSLPDQTLQPASQIERQ